MSGFVHCSHPSLGRCDLSRDSGEWECDDGALKERLDAGLDAVAARVSGADPDPDLTIARDQMRDVGGEVLLADPPQEDPEQDDLVDR